MRAVLSLKNIIVILNVRYGLNQSGGVCSGVWQVVSSLSVQTRSHCSDFSPLRPPEVSRFIFALATSSLTFRKLRNVSHDLWPLTDVTLPPSPPTLPSAPPEVARGGRTLFHVVWSVAPPRGSVVCVGHFLVLPYYLSICLSIYEILIDFS